MASTVSNGNDRSEKWQRPFTKGKFASACCQAPLCLATQAIGYKAPVASPSPLLLSVVPVPPRRGQKLDLADRGS